MGLLETVRYVEKICERGLLKFTDEIYADVGRLIFTVDPGGPDETHHDLTDERYVALSPTERLISASGGVSLGAQGVAYTVRPVGPMFDMQLPRQADIKFPAIVFSRIGSLNLLVADDTQESDVFFVIDSRCNPMVEKRYKERFPHLWYAAVHLDAIVSRILVKAKHVVNVSNTADGFLGCLLYTSPSPRDS